MSSISSEYSLKREYDEWNDRLEQMTWKATHSTRENQKYPNWNPESEKEWAEKIRRITEEQPSEGSDAVACHRNKRSVKTKEQIETEKLLHRESSVYRTLRLPECIFDKVDTNLKNTVLVADRYPRDELKGLSEEELIANSDRRLMEGDLTTEEIRRWKKFSRREAVYSLTKENFENLMRRFERGRQLQNPNYEEIRSRKPQAEYRGGLDNNNNKCKPASPSIPTPSYMSRVRGVPHRDEEKRRSIRHSRSQSRSPTRSTQVDRRRERISRSRSTSPRNVEGERYRRRNARSRSKSPTRSTQVDRRRERMSRSRSTSPRKNVEVERYR